MPSMWNMFHTKLLEKAYHQFFQLPGVKVTSDTWVMDWKIEWTEYIKYAVTWIIIHEENNPLLWITFE